MKKVLSFIMAAALAVGMSTAAFAATPSAINTVKDMTLGTSTESTGTAKNEASSDFYTDVINPQDETVIKFIITPEFFDWGTTDEPTYVTKAHLDRAKITVSARKTKGFPAMKSIEIKSAAKDKNAYVELKFVTEFVSVNKEAFEYDVRLMKDKKTVDGTNVKVYGDIENEIEEVDADNDSVETFDGVVVKATESVKGIELNAGNGVYVKTNMFEDCKYYVKAVMDLSKSDLELMEKNVPIEGIVTMKTALSKNATLRSAVVTFDIADTYYVYDNKELLGTTNDKVPFRDKYYLTTSKIDMGGGVVETTPDAAPVEPTEPSNPSTGGDNGAPNVNDNPGTGVNGMVNVAVVAGVVALAAAGAVCLKK